MVEIEEIQHYLMKHCPFLFSPNQFRIVDSDSSESFGNAFLVLEHKNLRLKFIKDKGQLFLDFQPMSSNRKKDWFSIDIVMQLVTGNIESSSEMDTDKAKFIKSNLDEIQRLFSSPNLEVTIKKLRELERARAKRLFG
ncbi:MAG: hypothetical protein ACFE9S_14470 [Candidatus Hermodarchaeota archaeon]